MGELVLSGSLADHLVVADLEPVAQGHLLLFFLIEGQACQPDHDHYKTDVGNVSAVAPHVAPGEVIHGASQVGVQLVLKHTSAAEELRSYGCNHQNAQHDLHPGVEAGNLRIPKPEPNKFGEAPPRTHCRA